MSGLPDLDELQRLSNRWREIGAIQVYNTPPELDVEYRNARADLLYAVPDLISRVRALEADNERLRVYIDLCADKFGGNEMPFDPTDTGLMSAINPEGEGRDDER